MFNNLLIEVKWIRSKYGMAEYIYMVIEYMVFSLYLVFVFLSVQIWFLWKDINKDEVKFRHFFVGETFFKKNSVYVFSFSSFFIIREFDFINDTYSGFFNIMALISIVLFTYSWYSTLKPYANRKILPREFTPKEKMG
jgi:hypothetical protein